jgi:hypothetical protein
VEEQMKKMFSLSLPAFAMAAGVLLAASAAGGGQQPPPIGGVTGTIALEGTVEKTSQGVNAVVVKTIDGIEHLVHLTERTVVHGGRVGGSEALRGIEPGSRVVVHLTQDVGHQTVNEVDRVADDGLKTIEGVVTNIDRRAKTMSIRLANGSRQTLQLTERAASDVGRDIDAGAAGSAKVVVYFNDEAGQRVAHYFKRIS